MFWGESKESVPPALVLTWNGTNTRILCPYSCPKAIHSHGTNMPCIDTINSRLAHCEVDLKGPRKQYRLVYPFEVEAPQGLWWELDKQRRRWRTVGCSIYDPEYEQSQEIQADIVARESGQNGSTNGELDDPESASDEDTDDEGSDISSLSLNRLDLRDSETISQQAEREERQTFHSSCVLNDRETVAEVLERSSDPVKLLRSKCPFAKKSALHMVCEEGHVEIVNLLLEFEASLEDKDVDDNTPLLSAILFGHCVVASRLMQAGAETAITNAKGVSLIEETRRLMSQQEEQCKFHQKRVDSPRVQEKKPEDHKQIQKMYDSEGQCVMEYFEDHPLPTTVSDEQRERAMTQLRLINESMVYLKHIIRSCETKEASSQMETLLRKISDNHGEAQSQHLRLYRDFNVDMIIASIMHKTFWTPLDNSWKTVACMTRGMPLPYTFAVSGWTLGTYGKGDGALDRTVWVNKVFKLAKILQHDLGEDYRDDLERPGSFLACHSEKQLLAYLVDQHTSAFLQLDDPEDILSDLHKATWTAGKAVVEKCDPPTLERLEVNIFVCQPGQRRAWVCDDCAEFCRKTAEIFRLRLALHAVEQSGDMLSHKQLMSWP